MDNFDDITPAEIINLNWEIEEGISDPNDVILLMKYYCFLQNGNKPIPSEIEDFIRKSFERFLSKKHSLERSFGLKRKKGRPTADELSEWLTARNVLEYTQSGMTFEEATQEVANEMSRGETQVRAAAAKYKPEAEALLNLKRQRKSPT